MHKTRAAPNPYMQSIVRFPSLVAIRTPTSRVQETVPFESHARRRRSLRQYSAVECRSRRCHNKTARQAIVVHSSSSSHPPQTARVFFVVEKDANGWLGLRRTTTWHTHVVSLRHVHTAQLYSRPSPDYCAGQSAAEVSLAHNTAASRGHDDTASAYTSSVPYKL